MKLQSILWAMFFIAATNSLLLAQNSIVNDAILLQEKVEDKKIVIDQEALDILAKYSPNIEKPGDIEPDFREKGNKFILAQGALIPSRNADESTGDLIANAIPSALSSIGGMNVTALADGLARFLVNRAKQELAITFFDRMLTALEKDEAEDFRTLFPTTTKVLQTIEDEIYDYQRFWSALREAFEKDLADLYPHLKQVLAKRLADKKIAGMLIVLAGLVDDISNGVHPGDIIHKQADADWEGMGLNPNVKPAIQTVDLLSQSLRSSEDDRYWVSLEKVLQLDENGWTIYLGLLYQQLEGNGPVFKIENDPKSFKTILDNVATATATAKIDSMKRIVQQIALEAEEIQRGLKGARSNDGTIDFNQVARVMESMLDLIEGGKEFTVLANIPLGDGLDKVLRYAGSFMDIYTDIKSRRYASAIIGSINLLDAALGDNDKAENLRKNLLKYGTFMADVVEAETAEEVEAALEAAALPAGSSRIKKESSWNVAVQSYVGANLLNIPDRSNLARLDGKVGLYAPVGLGISKGFGGDEWRMSASLFVSLINVGGIANLRFTDDETGIEGEITVDDIWNPGLNFALGLPKVPISLGIGYQVGPRLQNVDASGNPVRSGSENGWDWHYFLGVDIPLFNLGTKNNK